MAVRAPQSQVSKESLGKLGATALTGNSIAKRDSQSQDSELAIPVTAYMKQQSDAAHRRENDGVLILPSLAVSYMPHGQWHNSLGKSYILRA